MPKRKKKKPADDPLEAYKRIRKPMPPPERVDHDRRKKMLDDEAEREMRKGE
jgi:hypothetical protein